ncbi:energy coupling factor transporter S component ThiW [Sedimentibacter sp. MB31-C6]|uniref:energy coupling factor transporter S component ThiW n=1 Tax=Sedimentibacter sp. MB31-C6 TaxID=3109366 RepID=UPI002DDD5481|nr:energy coupling factor transporter S component ThiW [Sedimentibacter sp. MB36-C1]WSI04243.1 energy coupling factor transporter S component ThiW [Sedimentibacter sp. MB36-C1]
MIKSKSIILKKKIFTALLACMGYVLNTFVWIPGMAPFQHFINVIAAVFLGPAWSFVCALIIGILRMILNGRPILAVIGAIVGAYFSGLLYKRFQKLYWAVLGEVIGTGIISAIISYPFMRLFYGLPKSSIFTYIPLFLPSSFMGAMLGLLLIKTLKKIKMFDSIKSLVNELDMNNKQ